MIDVGDDGDVSELHKNYFGVEIKGAIIGVLGVITTAQNQLVDLSSRPISNATLNSISACSLRLSL